MTTRNTISIKVVSLVGPCSFIRDYAPKMMSSYLEELEHEPFDVCEFVERLTWRTNNEAETDFDAELLKVISHLIIGLLIQPSLPSRYLPQESFTHTVADLNILAERQQRKCEKLEEELRGIQKSHSKAISQLQQQHKLSMNGFHDLDEKVNFVAKKIIHLGVQLENVNTPRSRIVEAQILLGHIMEFMVPGPTVSDLFTNEERLEEAADKIQKLYTIAQDLPADRFEDVRKKIETKYDKIEMKLIEEFVVSQKCNDVEGMRKLAAILSQFKGYSQCVDAYIEQSQAVSKEEDQENSRSETQLVFFRELTRARTSLQESSRCANTTTASFSWCLRIRNR